MEGVAVYLGAALLIAAGWAVASWPAAVAGLLARDEDGNRIPVTPAATRRTRLIGLALVGLGVVHLWYGPDAFRGPRDLGVP